MKTNEITKTEFLAEVKRLDGLRNRRLVDSDTGKVVLPFATPAMLEASDETTEGHIHVVETAWGWRVVPAGGESLAHIEHPGAPIVRAFVEAYPWGSARGAGDWFDAACEIGLDENDTATSLAALCLDDEQINRAQS